MTTEERQAEAGTRQEETAETGASQVSRRQFARDALLRVGWAVPLAMAMHSGVEAADPAFALHTDTHGDRGHIDGHTDTHSDSSSPIHIDKHYDKHFDAPHLDRHGDA